MYYVRITYVAMYNQMCDFICVASNSDQNSSHQYFLKSLYTACLHSCSYMIATYIDSYGKYNSFCSIHYGLDQ